MYQGRQSLERGITQGKLGAPVIGGWLPRYVVCIHKLWKWNMSISMGEKVCKGKEDVGIEKEKGVG